MLIRSMALLASLLMSLTFAKNSSAQNTTGMYEPTVAKLEKEFTATAGADVAKRASRGMRQMLTLWRAEDGDTETFEKFVRTNFAADQKTLDQLFIRFETILEQLDGHMLEIVRELREASDLDTGRLLPVDAPLAGYDPAAHLDEDFFANKVAFVVLLNFPMTTLDERLANAEKWSRREWAEVRLAQRFSRRVPAEVNLEIGRASAEAEAYIAEYNIWMHHLIDDKGKRLFPAKLRLLSHWNLRDEIKADYSDPAGIAKQRMIQKVMERIVTQTIPAVVVDNPHVDWNPFTNEVKPAAVRDTDTIPPQDLRISNDPEPNERYRQLLNMFQASRKADPYSPVAPTLIQRRFNEAREIPEPRVRQILEQVVQSPLVPQIAKLIEKRLGRKLEPFDIWYNGFRSRGTYTEAQLDELVRRKYPTAAAYEKDLPRLLRDLGFSQERAELLANNIVVDPARGSGHAWGAASRDDKTHLRTRVAEGGMDYKGYNIAVHEMGHNVEQTISLNLIDHTLLQGVPNNAFTEALAFVFQGRDLELLGLSKTDEKSRALSTLNDFWGTYEIAGVAMVDMAVWHWMYDHPDATPEQLRDATVGISKDVWNRYFAPVFGKKDVVLLGVYSHMISSMLYLPDYPLGHLIAFQIEEHIEKSGNLGAEFERMAMTGRVTPDLWMKKATGKPVGPEALLEATARALKNVK